MERWPPEWALKSTPIGRPALVLVNALSFLACALVAPSCDYPPVPRPAQQRRSQALADRRFYGLPILNGAMSLQYVVLTLALPLWIAWHTSAPRWTDRNRHADQHVHVRVPPGPDR